MVPSSHRILMQLLAETPSIQLIMYDNIWEGLNKYFIRKNKMWMIKCTLQIVEYWLFTP